METVTYANNSIFRKMILLFMKKECFGLLYWNFSACNVEGILRTAGLSDVQAIGILVERIDQEVTVKILSGWQSFVVS